jgi:hypothetical protein
VLRLHDAPEGPTSITGTARLALAIFYIVITPLSGHTQVEVAKSDCNKLIIRALAAMA